MSFKNICKIPTVEEIMELIPITPHIKKIKEERDKEIQSVFLGKSKKFILIIGPCSADDEKAVIEYIVRLAKLQEKVKETLVIIPRIYTNKPRTTGEGYKGMVHQPDPQQAPDMLEGLRAIRTLHIRSIQETGLTAADEMLYPENFPYLEDLLSYNAVGARSVENQQHRLTASGIDGPVGMKNPTSGDIEVMLNSVQAAQMSHIFIYKGWAVSTSGNSLAHCILRGAFNKHGQSIPNYHFEDLNRLAERYLQRGLKNPAILVDTNHANSAKVYSDQPRIAKEIMRNRHYSKELNQMVKGLMIESYLVEGAQKVSDGVYGKSITDPCLGWDDSENLVMELADLV